MFVPFWGTNGKRGPAFAPVSYTHLDVYKRQECNCMDLSNASSQEAFFNRLYEERFTKMKRYAQALLSNPELAEEVVQDAFLELYLHIDRVMAHEKPEFWLQKAVRYKALHKLRERARDLKQYVSLDSDTIPSIAAPDEFGKVEEEPDRLEKLNRDVYKRQAQPRSPRASRAFRARWRCSSISWWKAFWSRVMPCSSTISRVRSMGKP